MERRDSDEGKVVPVARKTLQDVIEELHRVFDEDNVDVNCVKELLESYSSRPSDWKKYVNFDAYRYTRNLVDDGNGKFNLMILCWGEGQSSNIHDHSDAHCFVKILAGQLKETIYDWPSLSSSSCSVSPTSSASSPSSASASSLDPGQPMLEKDMHSYIKDQVTYMNDSIGVHRVENPSHSDRSISLHLYSPPFDSCNLFDIRTGQMRSARMTFWSRKGKLELSEPDFHENALQPRPLNGLLSKIGC